MFIFSRPSPACEFEWPNGDWEILIRQQQIPPIWPTIRPRGLGKARAGTAKRKAFQGVTVPAKASPVRNDASGDPLAMRPPVQNPDLQANWLFVCSCERWHRSNPRISLRLRLRPHCLGRDLRKKRLAERLTCDKSLILKRKISKNACAAAAAKGAVMVNRRRNIFNGL